MHDSKVCFKCEIEKPLTMFYKHSRMADGRLNKCTDCTKIDVAKRAIEKYDYIREYEKSRASKPHRVEARLRYSQTEEGKASARKSRSKWLESNLIKRSAHILVGNYVKAGKIIKSESCEVCGISGVRIHGHHDDYAFPLSVRWLCSKCHAKWHKENGVGKFW